MTSLATEGVTVILNGRRAERLETAAKQVRADVPDASLRLVVADVRTDEGVRAVTTAEPSVDILVNNAGFYAPAAFTDITDSEWSHYWEVNALSGIRLARHYLPGMLERNDGRIIFLATDAAVIVTSEMMHYEVTKAAVLALSRGLADLARGTAVTVNFVIPGPTATDGMNGVLDAIAEQASISREDVISGFFAQGRPASLLQRLAAPQEVANMITYLASPRSAATNKSAVRVEGGSIPTAV